MNRITRISCASLLALLGSLSSRAYGQGPQSASDQPAALEASRAAHMQRTRGEIESLIAKYGGIETLQASLAPLLQKVNEIIDQDPNRGDRSFLLGGNSFGKDISLSAVKPEWQERSNGGRNQFDSRTAIIDFHQKLKQIGIDLIVIPVPSKIEAYSELFQVPLPEGSPVALGRLNIMLDLLASGVEVIDVLPTILDAKEPGDEVPVYETSGHHPSGLAVRLAGELVAERLARYEFAGRDHARFTDEVRDSGERVNPRVHMLAWQVLMDEQPYEHITDSEVVIIGDSNAFAYRGASWASQIAHYSGIPVTDISTSGGGPVAHQRLAGEGLESLERRRVVVWIVSSTHMERRGWNKVNLHAGVTMDGMLRAGDYDGVMERMLDNEEQGLELGLDEAGLKQLGKALVADDRAEDAIFVVELLVTGAPYSAAAIDALGEVLMAADEDERAIECFKKALTLNPNFDVRKNSLACLKKLGIDHTPPPPYKLSKQAQLGLLGEYAFDGARTGIVTLQDDGLHFELVDQDQTLMDPISDSVFTSQVGILFLFARGKDGLAESVTVSGRGIDMTGRRMRKER